MLFNSAEFLLVFLPVVLAGYYALRRWRSALSALAFLVLASLFFYGWWEPRYLILILGSTGFNFLMGLMIAARRRESGRTVLLVTLGVASNLGLLGYFKYANFFIGTVGTLSGSQFGAIDIILPLAISFFTFQQIAFLVDMAQGKADEPNFVTYCLFVTFFPQLIAGPIVHHREMIPQFLRSNDDGDVWQNLAVGFTIATIGLIKKTVLADRAGFWADQAFGAVERGVDINFVEAWIGVTAFSFQIYFDFSGYSDMAIGLARMFGIRLPLNFASPYKATSVIDFWRGWHMTLSRFLRDYLYIPLGGNRLGPARRYANVMIVMLIGGLWHGANWTFVAWGGLHGLYLVVNHGWRALCRAAGLTWSLPGGRWAGRVLTFAAVTVAWVFFRSESFPASLTMLRGMAGLNGVVLPSHYADALGGMAPRLAEMGVVFGALPTYGGGWQLIWLAGLLAIVWLLPNTQEVMREFRPALGVTPGVRAVPRRLALASWLVWRPSLSGGLAIGAVASVLALRLLQGASGEFIYFQF